MKRAIINPGDRTHRIVAKNQTYRIDRVEQIGTCLYFGRPFVDHPSVRYFEAWLLPEHGWQVCRYTPHAGAHWCDWYVDICRIEMRDGAYHVTDLYLDVAVHDGKRYEMLDGDEFGEAIAVGDVTPGVACYALDAMQRLCHALAQVDCRMQPLLEAALYPESAQAGALGAAVASRRGKGACGGSSGLE